MAPTLLPLESIAQLKNWWQLRGEQSNIAKVKVAKRTGDSSLHIPSLMGFDCGEFAFDPWFTEWSQGAEGTSANGKRTAANVYNFSYWQYVDISYYLSHSLLTIPPTVWTNACHKNGVSSLGTVNLNWEDSNGKLSEEDVKAFLIPKPPTPDPSKLYLEDAIKTLLAISQYFGFDGYLLNLEVEMEPQVPGMLTMLSQLKQSGCQTIWYDSPFSSAGDYANKLTQAAYKFFEAASYFQSNYWWDGARGYPQQSWQVLEANSKSPLPDRNRMFMGKYCSRDGGTPPYANSAFFDALDAIKSDGISTNPPDYFTGLNVYYPAWDMYDLRAQPTGSNTDRLPDRGIFHSNDQAFWTGTKESVIFPDNTVRITSAQCMKTYVEERSVIASLPFVTYFNDGEGDFYNISGITESTGPWNNLSDQSVLPTYRFFFDYPNSRKNKTAIAHPASDYVFTGGSCLSVDFDDQSGLTFALFKTEITLPATSLISLFRKQTNVKVEIVILATSDGATVNLKPTKIDDLNKGWQRVEYELPTNLAGKVVTEISLQLSKAASADASYYLGQFKFISSASPFQPRLVRFSPPVEEVLDWSDKFDPTSHYRVYGSANDQQYHLIGIVYNSVYRVRYGNNEADHIFNPNMKGFNYYKVQEVDKYGEALQFDRLQKAALP
jgi:endo-beta-N-acetylglucosaminidase D